ncbi:MAG: polyprenyl synthetase [Deltaproteobacteria bacterium]|jgi:octaprenyl-diphosphate synthase|nr:polyprenyl synthetase [Deltaproteobacteria bacterium]MBT7204588.1 polyprenyl synthetase [Deltaproteobacteria bacterium]
MSDSSSLLFESEVQRINSAIKTNLQGPVPFLSDIIRYLIDSHYTPYRSFLVLRCSELFQPDQPEAAYHTASTLEFLHVASVLHRNITETNQTRRQMRSLDSLWGNEASLLLGDYLLSISFQILTRLDQIEILQCVSWATRSIARGQILEVSERASSHNDPEKCLQVYREKDASLLAAAAKCGAIWGGANSNLQEQLMTFGEKWGVALVLKNDLKIIDDTELLKEKITAKLSFFPLNVWLRDLSDPEQEEWQQKIENPNKKVILELISKLKEDPKEKTLSVMQKFLREAQEILYGIPDLKIRKLHEASFAEFATQNV